MKVPVDFSDHIVTTFPKVDPGWYQAEITDAYVDEAHTGTSFLSVEFLIFGPSLDKRRLWSNFFLTKDASWKLAKLQYALRFEVGSELETDDLMGKELRIRVKDVEDRDGNLRPEVVAFRRSKAEDTS